MNHRLTRAAAAVGCVIAAAACGDSAASNGSDDSQDMEVVGGGSPNSQIRGYVSDIDVRQDSVVLVGQLGADRPALWRIDGGELERTPLPGEDMPTDVEVAPDGSVFFVDNSGIWRVDGTEAELEVGDPDAPRAAPQNEEGDIGTVAVDDRGRLLWTAALTEKYHGDIRNPLVIRRLDGDQVSTIAGTATSPASTEEILEWQADPPPGTQAQGLALLSGDEGDLAADSTGIYLLASTYLIRISPDGMLSKVAGGEERDLPDEPFATEGAAREVGFGISGGVSVDEGRAVIVDDAFESEIDQNGNFTWTGDFTRGQQKLIDEVMNVGPSGEGEPHALGSVALLVADDQTATAAAHVQAAALDAGRLYVVGQVQPMDAGRYEAVVVRTKVPDLQ